MTAARVTDKEFLIAFSYADRDRAKVIRNYRWDPGEKVWRYPLTRKTYQALRREFDADELDFSGNVSKLTEWDHQAQADSEFQAFTSSLPDDEDGDDDDLDGSEEYRFAVSVDEMARAHGFAGNSLAELFRFVQAGVSGRADEALAETRIAIQSAELASARADIARLRAEKQSIRGTFESALVDAVWGAADGPRPDFLDSFKFDADGVIKAAEWVVRSLRTILHKEGSFGSLFELAREATDAQILSKDAFRLCETLRHERNKFAHDRLDSSEALRHAMLALIAFSFVHREINSRLSGPSSAE